MAFYIQNPKTNKKARIKNLEFYPAFLFLPKECFANYPSILERLPRNPQKLIRDKKALDFIASNEFLLVIIDFFAIGVWPFIAARHGLDPKMESYSGYDAAWMIAHSASVWIKTLEDYNIIPRMSSFLSNCKDINENFGFICPAEFYATLELIVPIALERTGLDEMIEAHKENRCLEDFDYRDSYDKIDMYRSWYHTRSRFETISLESFIEDYSENNDGMEWDIYDPRIDIDLMVTAKVFTEGFFKELDDKDQVILTQRMQGRTHKEVASITGFKNHSAVIKRMAKIEARFLDYVDEDYHLETYIKPEFREVFREKIQNNDGKGIQEHFDVSVADI